MLATYENRAAFEEGVATRLARLGADVGIRAALAEGVASGDESLRQEASDRATSELQMRVGRWFLRDDDLPFFETLVAVGPVVATVIATGGLALPVGVGALATLAGGTWRVWRKGGHLTRDQMVVLAALKSHGALDRDQLEAMLAEGDQAGAPVDVLEALNQLQDVELEDGTAVSLVRRRSDGCWHTVGV